MNKYPLIIKSSLFSKYPELFFAFSTKDWMDYGKDPVINDDKSDLLKQKGIKKRFKSFFEYINISTDNIITQTQIHSTNINYGEVSGHFDNSDGLHTDKKNIFLTIKAADCIPIFLYDPVKKVIAGVHSGWKGSRDKILSKMISILKENYGINSANIVAYIGPGISKEHYEVSKEIADFFSEESKELKNGKFYLDLKTDNLFQLLNCGVRRGNIEISPLCTYANSNILFSYRKEKENAGRLIGVIGLIH
jgi:YfiH family protein